jgi:hypothetical protein
MSRVFTDGEFRSWETYASGGNYGLPELPRVVFHCLSEQDRRARYVRFEGNQASAEEAVADMPDDRLRELLAQSKELD